VSSILHVCAYAGYIWLLGATGVIFASQIAYVVTIAGVFISAVALNEAYSSWVWAALGLMLVGLALVHPRKNAG
jgi:drug/metabolite transporter (DMT)-like permease